MQTILILESDNQPLVDMVKKIDPYVTVIPFYTMDMDDLSFIAKHRILPADTLIVLENSKVICRLVDVEFTLELLQQTYSLLGRI